MMHLLVSQLAIAPGTKVRARLLKSIQEKGILTPILVEHNGAEYKILDGRRRVAAAIQLGLEKVPAVLVEGGGPEITLLAHGTRSENPVAELEAICELQRRGLSEKEIAHAGYSSISRIRRLAKLNRLAPELAEKVSDGKIAPGVAFQIASLPQEEQRQLLVDDEKVTASTVRQAKYAHRQTAIPALTGWAEQIEPVTIEEVLACLSAETLLHILDELPVGPRFGVWRAKIQRQLKEPVL